MNIWYIHHYGGGPSLGSYDRPYQLGKAWQKLGHSPTVFIAAFHHLLQRKPPLEAKLSIDGVPYLTVPARPYSKNGIDRLLNIWDFSRNLYSAGRTFGQGIAPPDLVIASSPHPFTIFAAHKLARRHGAKLAFEIRDIWPLSITEILGTSRFHPFVQMCAFAERFALKNADLIASVLPRADRYLAERGYGDKPFIWVPNGIGTVSEGSTSSRDKDNAASMIVDEWRRQGNVVIAHAGSLGKPNAIDLLLEAVAFGNSTGQALNCRVLLIGGGQEADVLLRLAKHLGVNGIHFSGRLPKEEVGTILRKVDIGYAGVKPHDRLYKFGVSLNKFADYFRASLPVFLPLEPCGDPVSESGGGIARRAETPEAVWNALHELVRLSPEQRLALGEKGRTYMMREYDYTDIARRYLDAVSQL